MSELMIVHEIPMPLEVLPEALGNRALELAKQASELAVTDRASFDAANMTLVDLHLVAKDIEARRTALKKPITQLGKAIDAVCASVSGPMDVAKRSLMGRTQAYQRAEQEREERERRAAEEAWRKAEAEARAERERLEAEARAQAEAEAAELSAVLGEEVKPEPVPMPAVPVAPVAAAPVRPAPQASAMVTRKVRVLVVDDDAAIPAYIGGACVRPVDKVALKKLLEAGVAVPGARIEEQDQVAMRGAR